MNDEICPMSRTSDNRKLRQAPPNREVAFAFQLHDTTRNLLSFGMLDQATFDKGLRILESQINAYRELTRKQTCSLLSGGHIVGAYHDKDNGGAVYENQLRGLRKQIFNDTDWFQFCPQCGTGLPKVEWVGRKALQL